jgi:trk system potassium uptake protein
MIPTIESRIRNPVNLRRHVTPSVRLIAGLGVLLLIGTLLMNLPGIGVDGRLQFIEALFTAVSAITCTGLTVITPAVDLTILGQFFLLCLIQVGGVGYMTSAILVLQLAGQRISMLDRIALRDAFGLLRTGAIIDFAKQVIVIVLTVEIIGVALLWLHWRNILPEASPTLWLTIFHVVSAFCNAGFDLFTGQSAFPEGIPTDNITLAIMGSLIFLGSIGFPVIANFISYHKSKRLTLHTRLTVAITVLILVTGTASLILSESLPGGLLINEAPLRRFSLALYQIISTRTAGFAAMGGFQAFSSASRLMIITLMFIGASPGSMGGGMKTGTLITLLLTTWAYTRSAQTVTIRKRTLPWGIIRRATAVLLISILVVALATWLILLTHPENLETVLFEVISAFATCGYTISLTARLSPFGLVILMFTMFWGKLGPITIAVALTGTLRKHLVKYPEEQILIG